MAVVHKERRDAEWAVQTIRTLKQATNNRKELLSHIRKLPSHIQTSGLAQTLLFYADKSPELAKQLAVYVLGGKNVTERVEWLVGDASRFREKTRRALAVAQWLKRVAEVELAGG